MIDMLYKPTSQSASYSLSISSFNIEEIVITLLINDTIMYIDVNRNEMIYKDRYCHHYHSALVVKPYM